MVRPGRRGVRRIRPAHGRDGAVHQARARAGPARRRPAGPARLARCRCDRAVLRAAAGAPAGRLRAAHDDERARLPGPVVRDRPSEGDHGGVRDHRHVPGNPLAGDRLRPAASLHGRDRRRVQGVGPAARRHGRHLARRSHRRHERRARRSAASRRWRGCSISDGAARGVVLENGEEIGARHVISTVDARRTFLGLLEPGTLEPSFEEGVARIRSAGRPAR